MTLMLTKIVSYVIYYHDYMCVELTVHGMMHDHDNTPQERINHGQVWIPFIKLAATKFWNVYFLPCIVKNHKYNP